MPVQLVALNAGPGIVVDQPILLIGRDLECDIQIDSRKVSRRHCVLAQVADYLIVRDLDSTNGIRINGVRVKEGRLQLGDELTIGSLRYQLRWEPKAGRAVNAVLPPIPKPPVSSAPLRDEDLESCEEPIALPEPNREKGPSKKRRKKKRNHQDKNRYPAIPRSDKPAGHVDKPLSGVIPDQPTLRPIGDILPRPQTPPVS
ncbi:MAG: FHA domain-containing protein [Gemmataceae bacterium]